MPADQPPNVAVYGFSSAGITNWWGSNVDPGAALADLLTDRLVNLGTVSVIDRSHLQAVMREQNLAAAGDVTPSTEAQLGHMLGAKYLFVGRIVQFEKTSGNGGVGGFLGGLGGASSSKTTLKVAMQVLEVNTGRIVQAIDEEQTASATSFAVAGFVPGAGGAGYTSQQFQSSAMGKLLSAAADDLAKKIDPTKFVSGPAAPAVTGRILDVDAGTGMITLNIGSEKGVAVGMMFSVVTTKQLVDPDSKKVIISEIPRGIIQVTSVSKDSSIAKKISGIARALDIVHTEQ